MVGIATTPGALRERPFSITESCTEISGLIRRLPNPPLAADAGIYRRSPGTDRGGDGEPGAGKIERL
jgi:hypothetical protein